jgi:hypothetical protein
MYLFIYNMLIYFIIYQSDGIVVGFTTTYATSVYCHWYCEFESRSGRGVQYYVIKFVRDLRQVGGFHRVLRFSSTNKTDLFVL